MSICTRIFLSFFFLYITTMSLKLSIMVEIQKVLTYVLL